MKELTRHPELRLLSSKSYVAPMLRRLHRLRTLIASIGIGVGTRTMMAERRILAMLISEPEEIINAILISKQI